MKIMYFCPTGVHASIVAAGVHLGMLEGEKPENINKIMGLPNYNSLHKEGYGAPIYMGTDELGSEVYTIPTGGMPEVSTKAIRSFMGVFGQINNELLLIDAFKYNNFWMRAGITISRIGLTWLGGRVFSYALGGMLPKYAAMASSAKENIRSGQGLGFP